MATMNSHGGTERLYARAAPRLQAYLRDWLATARAALVTVLLAMVWMSVPGAAERVLDRLPEKPDPAGRYVIYLHGRIIEDQGRRPTSPVWGVYEYDQILARLATDGATVVSEQRKPM